jgi:sarcosine oxidase subunit gamma
MFERRSALATRLADGGRDGADGRRRLRLGEITGWHLLQLAVFDRQGPACSAVVRRCLGVELPTSADTSTMATGHRLYRTAPDQYWLLGADPAALAALAAELPASVAASTPLGHARVLLTIEGDAARDVLAKGITVDLRPDAFGARRFAQTALHHTGVLLECEGAERYRLFVLRTFSASIWDWLIDAALPYGYDIGTQ